jgi:lipid-A-disaccharide synthase
MSSPSILVVTGETSGEQHFAGVVREFRREFGVDSAHWFGSGGRAMREQGVEVLVDVADLAAIGPMAAMANLRSYIGLYRDLQKEAKHRKPSLAVLVDFPDFNLRLAPKLRDLGIPVCYFIGPQLWAWRPGRVKTIRRYVDHMWVILPFEREFYQRHGIAAEYVGNPVAELACNMKGPGKMGGSEAQALVGLMPGSRRREILQNLPVLLEAAWHLSQSIPCRFLLIKAPGSCPESLEEDCRKWQVKNEMPLDLDFLQGETSELLPQVDCAIIKSGTATLEAMVLGVPFVMVYRMASLSYRLLKPWVKTDTFCLANLVAGRRIVPEFVQDNAEPKRIASHLLSWLKSPEKLDDVKQNLENASENLGERQAYRETAGKIAELLGIGEL